jgi:hypothetical protein
MPRLLLAAPILALALTPAVAHAEKRPAVCVHAWTPNINGGVCDPAHLSTPPSPPNCPSVYSPAYASGVAVCYTQ